MSANCNPNRLIRDVNDVDMDLNDNDVRDVNDDDVRDVPSLLRGSFFIAAALNPF